MQALAAVSEVEDEDVVILGFTRALEPHSGVLCRLSGEVANPVRK